jgi:TPR repeat protein
MPWSRRINVASEQRFGAAEVSSCTAASLSLRANRRIRVIVRRYVADNCSHTLAAYELWLRLQTADFDTGLQYLKNAAAQGYTAACLTLGKLFHDGAVVERDAAGAMLLFQMAAAGGSAAGWNSLGVCHEELGELVDAQRCYRCAALPRAITYFCLKSISAVQGGRIPRQRRRLRQPRSHAAMPRLGRRGERDGGPRRRAGKVAI